MRIGSNGLRVVIAMLLAVGAIIVTPRAVLADEIEQLKLVVNIVDGSLMDKNDAQAIAKAVDDILKQCDKYGIRMRVTPEIRTGVTKIDDLDPLPGEDVTRAQQEAICKAGEKEVKDGGYKMTVVESFEDANDNGGTIRNHPSSVVNEEMTADTWAHEMGHGLGLGHESDKNNLMYGFREDRTGTELTEDQCKKLKANLRQRGAERRCSEEQQDQGDCEPGTESANDAVFDPAGDVTNPIVDLEATFFAFDLDPVTPTLFTATRVGLFPGIPVSATYEIGFDTDNDPSTGEWLGLLPGFEFAAVVEATGVFPFEGTATANLIPLPGGVPIPLEDPEFLPVFRHVDVEEAPEVPDEEIAAEVALSIPVGELGPLVDPIRVAVVAVSGLDEDVLEPDTVNTLPSVGPELLVSPRTTDVGDLFNIEGSGFAANSDLTLLLANDLLGGTTTLGDGTFSTQANTPPLPAGNYLLDAIDGEGNFGLEVITIPAAVGGMAELPDAPGPSAPNYVALAALAAAGLVALSAGAWYARRRWVR